jgi:hypothetical protein
MSSNGQYQTAVVIGGKIYTSIDSGNTWVENTTAASRDWQSIAMSSDGQYQTAVVRGGKIYTSSDTGNTWVENTTAASLDWFTVSMSSTGQYQTAAVIGGTIYTSSDTGNNWVAKTQPGIANWMTVSMSSTGQYQIAGPQSGYIHISSDFGNTWILKSALGSNNWMLVSMSSSGKNVAIGAFPYPTYLYISTDFGNTITLNTNLNQNVEWTGLRISGNGVYILGYYQHNYLITVKANITSFTFNIDTGTTFFLTGPVPTANYSINFTITTLNTANTYLITVINKTSSVASFYCNAVQINGTGRTLLYTVRPTVITSSNALTGAVQTNQEFIMFYNSTTSAWVVLTNIKVFKSG